MINAERGFMKNLKALDKRLNCVFRPEHEHFVITYQRPYGEPVNLHCVKADDGGFRQPDNRDLKIIYDGDMSNRKADVVLAERAYELQHCRDKDVANAKDNIKHMTRMDKHQLINAYRKAGNVGKQRPAFRQVAYKPKGIVYK